MWFFDQLINIFSVPCIRHQDACCGNYGGDSGAGHCLKSIEFYEREQTLRTQVLNIGLNSQFSFLKPCEHPLSPFT